MGRKIFGSVASGKPVSLKTMEHHTIFTGETHLVGGFIAMENGDLMMVNDG